ncbi:GPI inositol-deacylase [Diachasma alloeum]|uniref:GPI inositol-deacylase n=1 Tax=Diachasma alloeum TaxID=454923 RepID=UPI0007385041|nr:GPI inositol-deacylase [Diachasma alloeum]XP_015119467.1 GPI inositol-deacylase [Diachasma alloeum]
MKVFVVHLSIFFISVIIFIIYTLGGLRYVSNLEENTCDLTYMFEYPQYVRIELDDKVEKLYPRYGLYAYGEGFVTDKLRKKQFTGIPVLFIPGNAGSHEQVRSLASVSLRLGLKQRTSYHFDYFSVSLAEGYSALYGGVLADQTAFVAESIQRILKLYKKKTEKIVLIGHSMGGIVAKAALLHNNPDNKTLASLLITLATPHIPRIAFDKTTCDFYHEVNNRAMDLKKLETSIISIGGGSRDIVVTTAQMIDPHADLSLIGSAVPDCWKALDHLSILWCRQFVIPLVRALFDSVDISEGNAIISNDHDKRLQAFNYHLTNRYANKYLTHYHEKVTFHSPGEWIEITEEQYTFRELNDKNKKKSDSSQIYLMIPIDQNFTHLGIDAIDLEVQDWLFTCSASHDRFKSCKWGWNLTNQTRVIPTFKRDLKKTVDLDLKYVRSNEELTHIVVRIPKTTSDSSTIHIDLYSLDDSSTSRGVIIPDTSLNWIPRGVSTISPVSKSSLLKLTGTNTRHYVHLRGFSDVLSVKLKKLDVNTHDDNDRKYAHAVIELLEPQSNSNSTVINQFRVLSIGDIGRKNIFRIQTSATPVLRFTLEPQYSYEFEIAQGGMIDRMGMYVRDRWDRLYLVLMSLCLLIISTRIDEEASGTRIMYFITTLGIILQDLVVEFSASLGFLYVLALSTCFTVIFSGSLVHNFAAKFLARAITLFPLSWYNWLLSEGTYEHLPILSSLLVMSLISTSCGAIAMLISVIIYLLKLTRMYEEYLEELLMSSFQIITKKFDKFLKSRKSRKSSEDNSEDINPKTNILNHLILFITWSLAAIPAVPSVLVWAKNFSYESRLSTEDPIMLWSWVVITGWGSLGLVRIPKRHTNKYINLIGVNLQRILGWLLLLTAGSKNPAFYQWTIPPIVALSITCIVILSLLSRFGREEDTQQEQIAENNGIISVVNGQTSVSGDNEISSESDEVKAKEN